METFDPQIEGIAETSPIQVPYFLYIIYVGTAYDQEHRLQNQPVWVSFLPLLAYGLGQVA